MVRRVARREPRAVVAPKRDIEVGGETVQVPTDYLTQEIDFTKKVLALFDLALIEGIDSDIDEARMKVLEKRIEFYDLYNNSLL